MGSVASSPDGLLGRFYSQRLTVKPPRGIQPWTAEFNRWVNSLPVVTAKGGKLKTTYETNYPKSMAELLELLRYERKSVEIDLRHADGLQATDKSRLEGTTKAVRLAAVVYHDCVLWLNHFAGREVVQPRAFRERLADEGDVEKLFKLIDVVAEFCSPSIDEERRKNLVDAIRVSRVVPVAAVTTAIEKPTPADAIDELNVSRGRISVLSPVAPTASASIIDKPALNAEKPLRKRTHVPIVAKKLGWLASIEKLAKKLRLKGKQRRVVELIIEVGGKCLIVNLASDDAIGWKVPYKNAVDGITKALNAKFGQHGFLFDKFDGSLCVEPMKAKSQKQK